MQAFAMFLDPPCRDSREPGPRFSEADEVDNWGANRKFEPSAGDRGGGDRGAWGAGGGFRDAPRGPGGPMGGPGRGPMFEPRPISKADEEDQWSRGRQFQQSGPDDRDRSDPRGRSGQRPGAASAADLEDKWTRRAAPPAEEQPAPAAANGERPRLKLAPRTLPVEGGAAASGGAAKSNPFGAAR
jgi:hypothetical protein